MQFQIECHPIKDYQTCLTCNDQFEMKQARVIVCDEKGDSYGDICPQCIAMGFDWIGRQIQNLSPRV